MWMGGSSPVADPKGNVYVATADGYDQGAGQAYDDGAYGGPIIADGLVWTIGDDGAVHGLNRATGRQVTSIHFGLPANHFPTPTAADRLLLLPGSSQIFAFMGPAGLPPAPSA